MKVSISRWARQGAVVGLLTLSVFGHAKADPGDRKRLGGAGEWANTVAGVVAKNNLYSVEGNGALYCTDLKTGKWKRVGTGTLPKTKFLMAAGTNLYAVLGDGSLYRVNPATGLKQRLGVAGEWKSVIAAAAFKGSIYSVMSKGGLYRSDITNGKWTKVSKDEFGGTVLMLTREKAGYSTPGLFTIEGDGSLYELNAADGTWKNVGPAAQWKNSKTGTIVSEVDTLYVVNSSGVLQWAILSAGENAKPSPMGKPLYKATKFLFVGHDGPMPTLYALDSDGSLYAVEMAPMAG